ncbi:MAG TPA: 5-(carboxyamino)imidazole ribonucleotide mutase [Candidatus Eremiobacteraceae bacterium]|jgi:5-(carboxyamino)imidazole ribonucleotide mutase|nr:5-(carboxyamino)imidazole ribonucleotide mutase [Candidatus Eremiobacteraceae bacterium]
MTKKPSKSKMGHLPAARVSAAPIAANADTTAKSGAGSANSRPLVGIIMGSSSDWETMEHAVKTLTDLGVPHETQVVSAHRTPDLLFEYASTAEHRGLEVLIAGAGGAAHLPGMTASKTVLPVLGVPVESKALKGLDSLLSIAQMPGGIPVGTLAIGKAGAINSALLAAAILGAKHPAIREALRKFREEQTERVLANPDPSLAQASSFRLTPPESSTDAANAPPAGVATNVKRKPA